MSVLKKIFYEPFLENSDNYKAIGTGFIKTAKDHGHLFYPLSDRDICWISEFNDVKELLSVQGVKLNIAFFIMMRYILSTVKLTL